MHSIHRYKYLPKVFLLIVLFFSGCSLSTDVIDFVSGRIGQYTVNDVLYDFTISDNATSYSDLECCRLAYASRGYDYIIYKGYDENNDPITVYLTELSDLKGVRTKYKGNEMIHASGFVWKSKTIISTVQDRQGIYSIDGTSYTFIISSDGYTIQDEYYNDVEIKILKIGDDWVEYRGTINGVTITIALTNITDYNGTYQRYEDDTKLAEFGFAWN